MKHIIRFVLLVALMTSIPAPVSAQTAPPAIGVHPGGAGPAAPNTVAWYDSLIQYSTIINCVSIIQGLPYYEYGTGVFAGFAADPNASLPGPGNIYYLHVYIAGMGNACSGQYFYLDIAPPASTSLAISVANPVLCYNDGVAFNAAAGCPVSLSTNNSLNPGAYPIWSPDSAHANLWPLPQGHSWEFRIPVVSSVALTNSAMQANVKMVDGNDNPWLRPQQGVYVFSSNPTILYPSPSMRSITTTTAHAYGSIYNHGTTGTVFLDMGTTISYGIPPLSGSIGSANNYDLDAPVSGLAPDTLYHWRFRFVPGVGSPVFGADQTFRTLPDGRVTIGQGSSADCTETAFTSALGTAPKSIVFNCGLSPITITLASANSISSNLVIDGGNLVNLAFSGTGSNFTVQAGAHLTLGDITLSNANNLSFNCGGAIYVASGAQLTLKETRFNNNKSIYQGGAICNWGASDITNTLFTHNASTSSHGGAIGNYGTLSITNSKFDGNTAAFNGGAIDNTGTLIVDRSTFSNNISSTRGGGINTYVGNLTLTNSTFNGNTAVFYGGGLANDSSTTSITNSTFWGNSTPNGGGGIEDSGSNTLTILNTTIANNTSGTSGGNISVGSANLNVVLKNTLLAAGSPNNCDAQVASLGYNLESGSSCGLAAPGDKTNRNPNLGFLQNNGGPTTTLVLYAGSPAIDAGTNTGCPAADQRGVARPVDGNRDGSPVCDIGSYESAPQTWRSYLPLARK